MNKKNCITRIILCLVLVLSISVSFAGCSGLGNLIREILPDYVTINLDNATLLSESDNNEQICTYQINAIITNNYSMDLDKLLISFNAPTNVEITKDGEKAKKEASLAVNENIELQWIVKIPMTYDNQNIDYSVSVTSTEIKPVEAYASVFVKGKNKNDNRMDFSKDTWDFENFSSKPVCLTQEDYNALIVGLDNTSVANLNRIISGKAGGYCFGFATSSILTKMGELKTVDIDDTVANVNDFPKNDTTKSVLAYYWMTQFFTLIQDEISAFSSKSDIDKISVLAEEAKEVESGGSPVLLCYSLVNDGKEGAHAVVAYANEEGQFSKRGKTYDSRILIYDSNRPNWSEDACLYYNSGTDEWDVPYWDRVDSIMLVLSDVNIMNVKNIADNRKSANSYLSVKNSENISILDMSGNVIAEINGTTVSGNNEIVAYRLEGNDEIQIAIPQGIAKQGFTVRSNESNNYEACVNYSNYYLEADADTGNSVTFDPNGSATINGKATDFKINITANEGYHSTDWHTIHIEGKSGENPQVSVNNEGYLISGNNLTKLDVYAENGKTAQKLDIKSADSTIMLSQDGENLSAKTDRDSDGKFETILVVGKSVDPINPLSGNSFNWWLIPIVIGGIAAVGGLVLLIIKLFGGKKKKSNTKKNKNNNSNDEWWM